MPKTLHIQGIFQCSLRSFIKLIIQWFLRLKINFYVGILPKSTSCYIKAVMFSLAEAVQKRWERILKWLRPIARNLDKLISDLPSQEQKIMERYLDNQPLKEISEKLGMSTDDIEVRVKRVIKRWKKTTK